MNGSGLRVAGSGNLEPETLNLEVVMPSGLESLGKLLLVFGIVIVAVGALLLFGGKIPFLGRLPGDIAIRREHWSFYFPLATSIVISLLLTLLFSLFSRR
jgi:hypothetical protein